ncbi:MAG TPA: class I SAM-dependent methyltransferase [Chitinophagales bacterium]|nr:class I SAM-dependent methyltransferase [Chitinophagales bacterium]
MISVILKPNREPSLLRHHPWLFSGAIAQVNGSPQAGDTVDVFSANKIWLGRGAFSPQSQIRIRIWTFDEKEALNVDFFRKRLKRAIDNRSHPSQGWNRYLPESSACRMVYGESDGLPGLIVDRYGNFLVTQFLSAGAERWKSEIVTLLNELLPNEGIYDRSDAGIREKEGLPLQKGLLSGKEPPELIEIQEGDCKFLVDARNGHKTGFYLDQRYNRALVAHCANDADVLNCFAYTGSFGVAALKAGAKSVTNIDSSADALKLAEKNNALNGLDKAKTENVVGDVFALLRKYRSDDRKFDVVILDPPKFVESLRHLEKAARGYKDINLLAFQIIKPGGWLFTFSCSGLLDAALFQKLVADAALDAGREALIVHRMNQSADHPVALTFPEGSYLKGLACKIG